MKKKILVLMILLSLSLYGQTNFNEITKTIKNVEKEINANVGVAIYNTQTDEIWDYNGNTRFPIMSTFKTIAAANILYNVDNNNQSLEEQIGITPDMILSYAPITKDYVDKKITLRDAAAAAMLMSDNTAANIMLKKIGGPENMTKFLRTIGDNTTRLDRIEPFLNEGLKGDTRDTTTPNAIVKTLNELIYGQTLSLNSKKQLKQWMMDNKVSDNLLRSVLPNGINIADRSGAGGYGSRGITAIVWSETVPPLIISIYLTQTDASFDDRNKSIAKIGDSIFKEYLK